MPNLYTQLYRRHGKPDGITRREMLQRCSCSIDVVASILPYERYVAAETVLTMRQMGGERVGVFRSAPTANEMVRDLRRAQAEGEVRCF